MKKDKVLLHILLLFGALIMLYPFFYMVMGSFMTNVEFKSIPPSIIPDQLLFSNYTDVFDLIPFADMYINSIILTVIRIFLAIFGSLLASYAFARLNFPLKNFLFATVLAIMMVPGQIYIFPQYLVINSLNLGNTMFALVFPGLVSAYGIFYMRQQLKSIPNEIIESATIDGTTTLGIIFRICAPIVKPGMFVLGLNAGLAAWNDFIWPLVVNTDPSKQTLPVGINILAGHYTINTPIQLAAAVMSVIPVVVIFIIMQSVFKNQGFGSAIK